MFLLISEAFQTLKDDQKKSSFAQRYQAVINRQFQTASQTEASHEPYQSAEDFFRQASSNAEAYEEFFKQFHRSQQGISLARMSRISGSLGLILGVMLGLLFSIGLLAIPGAIFGYLLGRSNPFLAPLFLGLTRFLGWVSLFILGGAVVMAKQFFLLALVLVGAWLFFGQCRSWARELGRR